MTKELTGSFLKDAFVTSVQAAYQQEQCHCATCLFLRAMGEAYEIPPMDDSDDEEANS
jgi:hypothetical protein